MTRTMLLAATMIGLGVSQAGASPISFTASPNGVPDPGFTAVDFAAPQAGVSVTFSGPFSGLQTGTSPTNAAPYFNGNGTAFGLHPNAGPDLDPYPSTGGPGSMVVSLSQPVQAAEAYWGSIDPGPWNVLTMLSGGVPIGSITGDQIQPGAHGDQGPGGSEFVRISSLVPITDFVFTASQPALELANLYLGPTATPNQVTEPSSLLLFGAGLVGLGLLSRQPRTTRRSAC